MEAWEGFKKGIWETRPDVRDFIQLNYAPYTGDGAFLSGPTARTAALTAEYEELLAKEREKGGVLDVDTERVSSLLTYPAGYLDKEKELIVGLQTDAPLKRGVNPFGRHPAWPNMRAKRTVTSSAKKSWKISSTRRR